MFFGRLSLLLGCAIVGLRGEPNCIFIVADDLGYADVGFNGSEEIPTPHLDRIAAEGVRFTNGYVSYAVCGPSRAGFMTGRYQDRFGFTINPVIDPTDPLAGVPLEEKMLSEVLKPAGYATMAVGKWHLGCHPTLVPSARGFDEFFGFLSGGHNYFPEDLNIGDLSQVSEMWGWYRTKILHNGQRIEIDDYLTDELSDAAVEFIKRKSADPFFLYLAYNAPHSPMQTTEKYRSRFPDIKDRRRQTYAGMVSALDDGVGRVLAALEEAGISKETMVVFLSDNGGPESVNASDNGLLRGGKGDPFEGGIRVPFAIRWPQEIAAGLVYERPVISLDIFATITAAAGVTPDPARPLDGVDLRPYLQGKVKGAPHPLLFWKMGKAPTRVIRQHDRKLILSAKGEQLYDLSEDLSEKRNLIKSEQAEAAKLEELFRVWDAGTLPTRFRGLGAWKKPK